MTRDDRLSGAVVDRFGDDVAVLVEVWAPWCGTCRAQAPRVASTASDRGVALTRVQADAHGDLVEALAVRSVPTLIGIHRGHEVGRLVGAQTPASIDSLAAATMAGHGAVRATPDRSLIMMRGVAGLLVAGAGVAVASVPLAIIGLGLVAWAVAGMVRS